MLDRFGKPIRVGWAEHELLWLEAAISLPRKLRNAAYRDIADMTGRSIEAVRARGFLLLAQTAEAKIQATSQKHIDQHTRAVAKRRAEIAAGINLPPSALRAPSKAQLMAGRHSVARPCELLDGT